jgi:hypothetical protein
LARFEAGSAKISFRDVYCIEKPTPGRNLIAWRKIVLDKRSINIKIKK